MRRRVTRGGHPTPKSALTSRPASGQLGAGPLPFPYSPLRPSSATRRLIESAPQVILSTTWHGATAGHPTKGRTMADEKKDKLDPRKSPRDTHGPVVKTGPTARHNRDRNQDGTWRKKRSDAGRPRG